MRRENFTGHKHLMYVGVIIMIIMVCVLLAAIKFLKGGMKMKTEKIGT